MLHRRLATCARRFNAKYNKRIPMKLKVLSLDLMCTERNNKLGRKENTHCCDEMARRMTCVLQFKINVGQGFDLYVAKISEERIRVRQLEINNNITIFIHNKIQIH